MSAALTFSTGDWRWHNEPKHWKLDKDNSALNVTTDDHTDFWQQTSYGFARDNGHLYGIKTQTAFTAQVHVSADYQHLYDQAGLMIRVDSTHWLKAGVELSDGQYQLSSVLTMGKSDWSTGHFNGNIDNGFWLRTTVADGVLRLQVSYDGKHWPLMRLVPFEFPSGTSYSVGPYCCTPERRGLEVKFSHFQLTPPLGKDLHDLS
jgi:regulation of enolase protein 1 (concanavalin A-like superfamily)